MHRIASSSLARNLLTRPRNYNQQPSGWRRSGNTVGRKNLSSNSGTSSTGKTAETAAEEAARQQVLHDANQTMKKYHDARLAKLRGELPSKQRPERGMNPSQLAIFGVFLVGFILSPFLGKKIAQDKEFREKYIPAWYDFTIKRPTSEMTREQVHEQILQLQKEIRARAIAGDFTDAKITKMRRSMDGAEEHADFNPNNDEHAWSKIHPGENVDDEEDE